MKLFKPFTPHVIAWSVRKSFNQSIRRTKEQKTRLQRLVSAMPRKLTTLVFIVFEWLNESNSTTLCDPSIESKSVQPWASVEIFPGGQRWNFSYPFQVADNVMRMDIHKTLYPFYPISLCWLNLNSQSFVWNVFYTFAISEMLFLLLKCLISILRALSTNKT